MKDLYDMSYKQLGERYGISKSEAYYICNPAAAERKNERWLRVSRAAVVEKGFSTDVVDTLDALFPLQINCYRNAPQRGVMAALLAQTRGVVYTIGEVKQGVAEEVELYQDSGVNICRLPLNWNGNMLSNPLSFGERLAGTTFNPSNDSDVDKVKQAAAAFMNAIENAYVAACASPMDDIVQDIWRESKLDALKSQMLAVKAITWKY